GEVASAGRRDGASDLGEVRSQLDLLASAARPLIAAAFSPSPAALAAKARTRDDTFKVDGPWDTEVAAWIGQPGARPSPAPNPAERAARATRGAGAPLPFLSLIQARFGAHDISGARAHIGGSAAEAAEELDARAFAV